MPIMDPGQFEKFMDFLAQKKRELVDLARAGAERPSGETKLGELLCRCVDPDDEYFDPAFIVEIEQIAPRWFVDAALRWFLGFGERETKFMATLRKYIDPKSEFFDASLASEFKQLTVHWATDFEAVLCMSLDPKSEAFDHSLFAEIERLTTQRLVDAATKEKKVLLALANYLAASV